MKILFVWPSSTKKKTLISSSEKPLTLLILASITPKKHSVKIVEMSPNNTNFDEKYDLAAITCTTQFAFLAYEIADELRRQGIKVVIGGWHPSALPEEAKQHADSVVVGEAEDTWPQLLKDIENGALKEFYFPTKPVDLKLLPDSRDIYKSNMHHPIQASRGCPYGCEFCAITNMKFRNIFRTRDVDDVVEEIRMLPGKVFSFHDNSLTINPAYTKELFKKIKGLDKKFHGFGNINVLGKDDEFLQLASEAGCITWYIGFESISQQSVDSVGKKTNKVEEYLQAIKKVHDYGMIIIGSFVFGFDFDTLDIFDRTAEFVKESKIDVPHFHQLVPYPGTIVYNKFDKEGRILTKEWDKYDVEHVVFQPKNMTPEELLSNVKILNKKFYRTSKCIGRILRAGKFGFDPLIETLFEHLEVKFLKYS